MSLLDDVRNSVDETIVILSTQEIFDNPENFGEPTDEFSFTLEDENGNSVTVGTVDVTETLVVGENTLVEGSVFFGSTSQFEETGRADNRTPELETRGPFDTSSFGAFSFFDSFSAFSFFDF